MPVSALVGANFKFGDVRLHGIVGQDHFRALVFQTAGFRRKELDLVEVWNQTGIEHANSALLTFTKRGRTAGDTHL